MKLLQKIRCWRGKHQVYGPFRQKQGKIIGGKIVLTCWHCGKEIKND